MTTTATSAPTTTTTTTTTRPRDGRRSATDATVRLAAVALPLGVVLPLIATQLHPHREDVMDNPVVFAEYAASTDWFTVHLAQWFAALLLFAGLGGVYYAVRTSGLAGGLARFGLAAVVQAAAGITALQAVDGVALKWAVDNWASAPPERKDATFAAAEALRFTEYGLQGYANVLLGLALALYGLAILVGRRQPGWLGALALGAAAGWIVHGVMVPYVGLFDSSPRLAGMVLLVVWSFGMAARMWRDTAARSEQPASEPDRSTGAVASV